MAVFSGDLHVYMHLTLSECIHFPHNFAEKLNKWNSWVAEKKQQKVHKIDEITF